MIKKVMQLFSEFELEIKEIIKLEKTLVVTPNGVIILFVTPFGVK